MNSSISEYMMRSNDDFNERIDHMEDKVDEILSSLVALQTSLHQITNQLDVVMSDSIKFNPASARGTSYEKYIKKP